jgi:hypothetical protein
LDRDSYRPTREFVVERIEEWLPAAGVVLGFGASLIRFVVAAAPVVRRLRRDRPGRTCPEWCGCDHAK